MSSLTSRPAAAALFPVSKAEPKAACPSIRDIARRLSTAFRRLVAPSNGEQRNENFFATSRWDGYGRNGVTWDGIGWRI